MKKWGKLCSLLCTLIFTISLLPINAFGEDLAEDTIMFEINDELSIGASDDYIETKNYNDDYESVHVLQDVGTTCGCEVQCEKIRRTL